jgi:hypothetical protein
MIQDHGHPGRHMQPMTFTSDMPLTTTNASDSTFLQHAASASPKPGACTQLTAKSLLPYNMTSPLQRQQTSSRCLGVLYHYPPPTQSSTYKHSGNSPRSWPGNKQTQQKLMHQLQGWLHHVQRWQLLHHQGWLPHLTTSQHPMPSDRCH